MAFFTSPTPTFHLQNVEHNSFLGYLWLINSTQMEKSLIKDGRRSLADKYEYIMHGKLYKISDESSGKLLKAEAYVSFGGILMLLRGEPSHLGHFELD